MDDCRRSCLPSLSAACLFCNTNDVTVPPTYALFSLHYSVLAWQWQTEQRAKTWLKGWGYRVGCKTKECVVSLPHRGLSCESWSPLAVHHIHSPFLFPNTVQARLELTAICPSHARPFFLLETVNKMAFIYYLMWWGLMTWWTMLWHGCLSLHPQIYIYIPYVFSSFVTECRWQQSPGKWQSFSVRLRKPWNGLEM